MAQSTLDEVDREVQSVGWHFNREYLVKLTPDATTKEILIANNVLRIDVEPKESRSITTKAGAAIDVVQRGGKLYDKTGHTYEFSQAVEATVVYGLGWDEVPQIMRHYITMRAGRLFCDRSVGSGDQHSFNMMQEFQALTAAQNWDSQMADHSIFDSWDVYRVINRQGRPNVL